MRTLSAKEVARDLGPVLDSMAQDGEEVVILRNGEPVATLVPWPARMNAMEALGDIHRTLSDAEGQAWLDDIRHREGPAG